MRNKLAIASCVVVVFILGFACAHYNHKYKVNAKANAAVAAARARTQAVVDEQRRDFAVRAEKARLKKECQKAEDNYARLTVAQKIGVEAPNCRLQILQ